MVKGYTAGRDRSVGKPEDEVLKYLIGKLEGEHIVASTSTLNDRSRTSRATRHSQSTGYISCGDDSEG